MLDTEEREPPNSIDAEQIILGTLLATPSSQPAVFDVLKPSDFHHEHHQRIYQAIQDVASTGKRADCLTVAAHLHALGQLDAMGGKIHLRDLESCAGVAQDITPYTSLVLEYAMRRWLSAQARRLVSDAMNTALPLPDVLNKAEQAIARCGLTPPGKQALPVLDILPPAPDYHTYQTKPRNTVATGYTDLDWMLTGRGLSRGNMVILAARPSVGKTALAMGIARRVALAGKAVVFYSLEMSAEDLTVQRLACMHGWVPSEKMMAGELDENEYTIYAKSVDEVRSLPIIINENPLITVPQMRAELRQIARKQDIGVVIIDYLGLMESKGNPENETVRVGKLSRSVKALAKATALPVILLSQLSRKCEEEKRRPKLSDLRQSGDIEQDADVVLFLHRDGDALGDSGWMTIEGIVAKQRGGRLGTFNLQYYPASTRFENSARGWQ